MLATVVVVASTAAARASGWGAPFAFAGPVTNDVLPLQAAFSAGGQLAIGYTVQDEDTPAAAKGFAVLRSSRGTLSLPRRVRGAKQVLALAFDGEALEVLTGAASRRSSCCTKVQAIRLTHGAFSRPRTVVRRLTGATVARLVPLPSGRLLAAVATGRGVWVSQSFAGGRFGGSRRLTAPSAMPQTMSAVALAGGTDAVAWTASPLAPLPGPARTVFVASGSATRPPATARRALTVARGHEIEQLSLARGASGATAAWLESWFDRRGRYRSATAAADLRGGRTRTKTLALSGGSASGLTFAGNARGDQVLAWSACDSRNSCAVDAVLRSAGGRFSRVLRLGAIDASQEPAAAISPSGESLVGWVSQGEVVAAAHRGHAPRFTAPQTVSSAGSADQVAIGFGPRGDAVAAWTDAGTQPSLIGAIYRGP